MSEKSNEVLNPVQQVKLKKELERAKIEELKRKRLEGELFDRKQVRVAIAEVLQKSKGLLCPDCQKVINSILEKC